VAHGPIVPLILQDGNSKTARRSAFYVSRLEHLGDNACSYLSNRGRSFDGPRLVNVACAVAISCGRLG
jgi:hypothetical protein